MARQADPARAEQWARRLERYAQSGGTVAAFCRAEGVSAPSFYQWKRKLSRDRAAKSGDDGRYDRKARQGQASAFQPVQVVGAGASNVTVRLGDSIAVDLGGDADTIARVVEQLWDLHRSAGGASC